MSNLLLNRIGVAGKKKIENIKNFSGSIIVDADRPWLGLASFTEDTQRFFFGRDTEIAEIFVRVRDNLLTTLYGQSGLGKSSLLGAGLLPKLRVEQFCPVQIRLRYHDGAPPLIDQVFSHLAEAGLVGAARPANLWEWLHHRETRPEELDTRPPVLVFDQFEENVLVPLLVRSRKERHDRIAREAARRKLAEEAVKSRKRRMVFGAMLLLTLVAAAGGVYGFIQASEAKKSESKALESERKAIGLAKIAEQETNNTRNALADAKTERGKAMDLAADAKHVGRQRRLPALQNEHPGANHRFAQTGHHPLANAAVSGDDQTNRRETDEWLPTGVPLELHLARQKPQSLHRRTHGQDPHRSKHAGLRLQNHGPEGQEVIAPPLLVWCLAPEMIEAGTIVTLSRAQCHRCGSRPRTGGANTRWNKNDSPPQPHRCAINGSPPFAGP
jgi:hypothetical protein